MDELCTTQPARCRQAGSPRSAGSPVGQAGARSRDAQHQAGIALPSPEEGKMKTKQASEQR